jgi:hypothetical protein
MEFRWVIFITLWTLLSGPAFHAPSATTRLTRPAPAASRSARPVSGLHTPSPLCPSR